MVSHLLTQAYLPQQMFNLLPQILSQVLPQVPEEPSAIF